MITVMSRFLDMTTDPSGYADGAYPAESEDLVPVRTARSRPLSRVKDEDKLKFFQYALLAYLFFYCSRIGELIPGARFAIVLMPILLVGLFMSGRSRAILEMRSGKALIAFTLWVAACVPTSLWRSDSLFVLRGTVQALLVIATMVALVRTVRGTFRVMYTIGLAMATVAIMGFLRGRGAGLDRLGAGGSATLADPNFFCLYVLVGICFLALSASVHKGLQRLLSMGLIVICLGAAAKSGSRMGLLAFAVAGLVFFLFGTERQKIYIIAIVFVMAVVVPPLLPQSVKDHVMTLFEPGKAGSKEAIVAAESAKLRKELFYRSLRFTYEHPFFGVGPGQFVQAEQQLAAEEGTKVVWAYSHNAYTETSSETGILGLILFVVAFFGAQVGLGRIRKFGPDLLTRRMALFTHLALIIATIGAAFLTLGYSGIIWVLIGVSGTFQLAVARQVRLSRDTQANGSKS
jgi:O-antigen ligase